MPDYEALWYLWMILLFSLQGLHLTLQLPWQRAHHKNTFPFHNVKGWNELAVNSLYWKEGSLTLHFKQVFAPYLDRDAQQMPCGMRLKPINSRHYTLNISAIDNNVLFQKIVNYSRSQIRARTVNFPSKGASPCKNKGGSIRSWFKRAKAVSTKPASSILLKVQLQKIRLLLKIFFCNISWGKVVSYGLKNLFEMDHNRKIMRNWISMHHPSLAGPVKGD